MQFGPILSAMRRNRAGPLLIAAEIAITLAILCNGLFVITQQVALSKRPTGTDEANILAITNQWVGDSPDLPARQQADLAALRSLPGVQDAFATNSVPLTNLGSSTGLSLRADQKNATTTTAVYFGDPHAITSLGVKLVAGRNFNSDEIRDLTGYTNFKPPAAFIITRALAEKLFPGGNAVGQSVFDETFRGLAPVVGVIDRLQGPWVSATGWGSQFSDYSVIEPFHIVGPYPIVYALRVQPGQMASVYQNAAKALFALSRSRVITKSQSLVTYRKEIYRDTKALAVILSVVCTALLGVVAFGIVGLTSYWVAQRRRQIGIRRALGAPRNAIVQYFQTENLLITGAGSAIGVVMAVSLNLWMVSHFAQQRLSLAYVLIAAVAVLLLGQLAVLWPALKAAAIPPSLAMRGR